MPSIGKVGKNTTKMSKRKIELQKLCRGYLLRLKGMARRHGLESAVKGFMRFYTNKIIGRTDYDKH